MSSIDEWVEKKLDEGADEEALRQVLREKGYDPNIVGEKAREDESQDQAEEPEQDISEVTTERDEKTDLDQESSSAESSGFGWKWDLTVLVLFLISMVVGLFLSGILPV